MEEAHIVLKIESQILNTELEHSDTLNSHIKPTGAGVFDLAHNLRDLLIYRLVVVGTQAQQAINQLLA